jgi:ABC-type iron transport system FetAB permease component
MAQHPFWQPDQYSACDLCSAWPAGAITYIADKPAVPILGMILGNAISAIGVAMNTISKEFSENRDKVETYLALGATRFEAVKLVGVDALKLALLPTVNQLRWVPACAIGSMAFAEHSRGQAGGLSD